MFGENRFPRSILPPTLHLAIFGFYILCVPSHKLRGVTLIRCSMVPTTHTRAHSLSSGFYSSSLYAVSGFVLDFRLLTDRT